jgi:mannose-1-phosphate guanylyltransferase
MIIPLILAGGAGKRLVAGIGAQCRAKPFLNFFGMGTLLERTLERVEALGYGKPWLSLNETQLPHLSAEFRDRFSLIIAEPSQRDTMPALTFASLEAQRQNKDAIVLAIPADQIYVDQTDFLDSMRDAVHMASTTKKMVVVGSKAKTPNTNFGYIKAEGDNVKYFTEKPLIYSAMKMYRDPDVFWNTGMLVTPASVFLCYADVFDDKATKQFVWGSHVTSVRQDNVIFPDVEYFPKAHAVSFDKGLLSRFGDQSKVQSIGMARLGSDWFDLGTFEGILSYLQDSEEGKKLQMEKPWGWHTVLVEDDQCKVKLLCINPRQSISLQSHKYRSEHWTIMQGRCKAKINGTMIELSKDSSSFIDKGVIHQAINSFNQPVYILEVQQGSTLDETDITRFST